MSETYGGHTEGRMADLEATVEGLTASIMGMCEVMDNLILKLASMTGAKGELGKDIAESMQKNMEDFYNRKMREVFDVVVEIDIGDNVLCDLCGKDWTNSNVSGGFMFAGKGVCPDCEPGLQEKAIQEEEEHFIQHRCPSDMSHADWIREVVRKASDEGSLKIKTIGEWMKRGGGTSE